MRASIWPSRDKPLCPSIFNINNVVAAIRSFLQPWLPKFNPDAKKSSPLFSGLTGLGDWASDSQLQLPSELFFLFLFDLVESTTWSPLSTTYLFLSSLLLSCHSLSNLLTSHFQHYFRFFGSNRRSLPSFLARTQLGSPRRRKRRRVHAAVARTLYHRQDSRNVSISHCRICKISQWRPTPWNPSLSRRSTGPSESSYGPTSISSIAQSWATLPQTSNSSRIRPRCQHWRKLRQVLCRITALFSLEESWWRDVLRSSWILFSWSTTSSWQ